MINYLDNSDFNSLSDKEIMILIGQDPGDHLLDARKVDYNLRLLRVNITEIDKSLSSEYLSQIFTVQ